ncbi:MAG: hypothetical protein WC623_22200 [Pedobacter sp.]|uniref:hypothetical protein n=1 Tax=Pedobacter sp. TaxID=1411316 RepID=UPI003569772C
MQDNEQLVKSIIIIALVSSLFVFSSIVISSYPQHILLGNDTVINNAVGNFINNTVNVRGNQVQFASNDIITLNGREYIKITGRQVQVGNSTYASGIRTINPSVSQNILFEQKIGTMNINNAGKVIVDSTEIVLIPITTTAIRISSTTDNFDIEFVNNIAYVKVQNVLLKLTNDGTTINTYLVGTDKHQQILFVVI